MRGFLRVGEAAKASTPAHPSFPGLQRPPGTPDGAAQRCRPVSLSPTGGLQAPWPLPLVLKSGFFRSYRGAAPRRCCGARGWLAAQGRPSEGKRSAAAGRAKRGLDLFLGQNRSREASKR